MKRQRFRLVGDVVRNILRDDGLETPLNEHRLLSALPEFLGGKIRPYLGKTRIQDDTLFVEIRSAPLRANLTMDSKRIKQELNKIVGAVVIQKIKFF